VFKRDVMVKYLKGWAPARAAIARGEKIVKAIGYDASKADLRRRGKADRATDKIRLKIVARTDCGKAPQADQWEVAHCEFAYYLQDWGLERASLAAIIEAAGLPLPCKSACFFCPASKPAEVVQLRLDHPDLFWRAVAMERRARDGRHGLTTKAGGLRASRGRRSAFARSRCEGGRRLAAIGVVDHPVSVPPRIRESSARVLRHPRMSDRHLMLQPRWHRA